jgi:hypothetical protein
VKRQWRFRFVADTFDAIRRRIIAETEAALTLGLTHPESVLRIPTIEVGTASFHPEFARRFWSVTLDIDLAELNPRAREARRFLTAKIA